MFFLKLIIIFEKEKKNVFWHNLKTDKDISKLLTDSSSAGQQLNDN